MLDGSNTSASRSGYFNVGECLAGREDGWIAESIWTILQGQKFQESNVDRPASSHKNKVVTPIQNKIISTVTDILVDPQSFYFLEAPNKYLQQSVSIVLLEGIPYSL